MNEALVEVALRRIGGAPGELELLVRAEELAPADEFEAALEGVFHAARRYQRHPAPCYAQHVATILLVGVDVFFRGKLEALLPGHHFVTADTAEQPDIVISDIARIDPDEVAEAYPDIPIVGFTSHTDTSGLRRAHAAGFDQVLVKSALSERAPQLIEELVATLE